jgi:hypothetical protein
MKKNQKNIEKRNNKRRRGEDETQVEDEEEAKGLEKDTAFIKAVENENLGL